MFKKLVKDEKSPVKSTKNLDTETTGNAESNAQSVEDLILQSLKTTPPITLEKMKKKMDKKKGDLNKKEVGFQFISNTFQDQLEDPGFLEVPLKCLASDYKKKYPFSWKDKLKTPPENMSSVIHHVNTTMPN